MTPNLDDGATKAAILMVLLGEDASARILQNLDESEVVEIGRRVAELEDVDPDLARKILDEYRDRILSHKDTSAGGPARAKRILAKSLPPDRAEAVANLIAGGAGAHLLGEGAQNADLFYSLAEMRDQDLSQSLEIEHPQTAALVLMHIDPSRAATILGSMAEENQAAVTVRLAKMTEIDAEVVRELSDAMSVRSGGTEDAGLEERDGAGAAAEILKNMDRGRSRAILVRLEDVDSECAESLRSRVYTFDMLLLLDDRGIQEVLKGVDPRSLATALKGETGEVSEKFFSNMSGRAAQLVKDEMEYLTAVKIKDVEAAQKEIIDKAMKLEEDGLVTFQGPGEE